MLLNPCSGPSTRYMMVPSKTEIINTKKTKTNIFVLLDFKARAKLFDSPTNRTNLRIRKTRSNLNALNAVKYCDPTKKNDRYFGIVDNKSIIPKKLNMYFLGFLILTSLRTYSIEKRMVTTHSEILKKSWYLLSKRGTLSIITIIILYKITISNIISNNFPAGVCVP
jgi:hypothetical protein